MLLDVWEALQIQEQKANGQQVCIIVLLLLGHGQIVKFVNEVMSCAMHI